MTALALTFAMVLLSSTCLALSVSVYILRHQQKTADTERTLLNGKILQLEDRERAYLALLLQVIKAIDNEMSGKDISDIIDKGVDAIYNDPS